MKNKYSFDLEAKSIELIENSYIENHSISTTSFGLTSAVLINLISQTNLDIPIVFVDTGFHFSETIDYYKTIISRYQKLNFIQLSPNLNKKTFLEIHGGNIYNEDPDFCCNINKVNPLNDYLEREGIKTWYTAVRKSQSAFRKTLNLKEKIREDLIKVHPLLYWTESDIDMYITANSLPSHPLKNHGFESIGCYPCTKIGSNRSGRWQKFAKTECGLHFKNK